MFGVNKMNKKDLEAFKNYKGHGAVLYPLDSDNIREIEQDAFEAGAIHGRSQLNELRDENMGELYSLLEKLQKDNEELLKVIRLFAFPEAKLEHEAVETRARQALIEAEKSYQKHELCGDVGTFAGINNMSQEDVAKYFYTDGYTEATKLHLGSLKQAIANSTAVDENLLLDAMKVYK